MPIGSRTEYFKIFREGLVAVFFEDVADCADGGIGIFRVGVGRVHEFRFVEARDSLGSREV